MTAGRAESSRDLWVLRMYSDNTYNTCTSQLKVLVATEKTNVNERRLLRREEENWISFCYLFI